MVDGLEDFDFGFEQFLFGFLELGEVDDFDGEPLFFIINSYSLVDIAAEPLTKEVLAAVLVLPDHPLLVALPILVHCAAQDLRCSIQGRVVQA